MPTTIELRFADGETFYPLGLGALSKCPACHQDMHIPGPGWRVVGARTVWFSAVSSGPITSITYFANETEHWKDSDCFATEAEAQAECDRRNEKGEC